MINGLSFDVEDYFQVSAFSSAIDRSEWDKIVPRVVENTVNVLDLLEVFNTRATFFILGWVAERFPDLVRTIHERGHEIASHGYEHRLVYHMTSQEFQADLARTAEAIKNACGVAVEGFRAASYSITKKSIWALDVLFEMGYAYDSSIFPVRHDRYGIPDSPRFPHTIRSGNGRDLVELPPSTLRWLGCNLPVAGGGYFRLFPYRLTAHAFHKLNREGHPGIFYLHPWEFDPQQPRINAPALSRFRHYRNLQKTESRFRRLLQTFRFAPLIELVRPHPGP